MTQRERQASGGTQAAPWRALGHPALPPAGGSPEPRPASAPLWEDLCRSVSPAQQLELLALAQRQGLLYAYQLPPAGNGIVRERGRQQLAQLLSGQIDALEPVQVTPVEVHDSALDPWQREAVAKALHTPDVCLLQGLPGAGKSRVVAEILTQLAARGERVLLLASTPAALDRVLERIGRRDVVFSLRCLERDEPPESLPPALRALTLADRVRCLREETLPRARQEVEASQQRCRHFEQHEAVWTRLEELVLRGQALDEHLEAVRARRRLVPVQVEQEAASRSTANPADSFLGQLLQSQSAREESLSRLDTALAALRGQLAERQQERATLANQCEALRPLVEAKRQGHWWNKAWWQATLQGDSVAEWTTLESRGQQLQADLEALEQQTLSLANERERAESTFQVEQAERINAEIAQRQAALNDQEAALRQELELLHQKWQALCLELEPDGSGPTARTPEGVRLARETWGRRRDQLEEQAGFARQWATYLEEAAETLAERLPTFANVVAATTTGLATDPHFGEAPAGATSGPFQFDWLVLEEADQVTESEFLNAARRARRWLLIGDSTVDHEQAEPHSQSAAGGRGKKDATPRVAHAKPARPASLRPGFFQRLWQHLHLPYVWAQEKDRLCCRLRPLAAEQQAWLESEPVTNSPEIELRILTVPRMAPTLAEVVFPLSLSISQAKQFIFQQLQELPLRTLGWSARWVEEPDRLVLLLGDMPVSNAVSVVLEAGVRELVGRIAPEANGDPRVVAAWHTYGVEFDRSAGWERPRAEEWVGQHLGPRDLGRTAFLDVPHRMQPDLAAFVGDLLFRGRYRQPTEADLAEWPPSTVSGCRAPVQFVPVPPLPKEGERGRGHDAERRTAAFSRKGGAGLELDLADARHRDRLPTELRAELPHQGLVNYLEAQAVVQALLALVADPDVRSLAETRGPFEPVIAVMALYEAQVELIRRLIGQLPDLAGCGVAIEVDLPAAFRQREASVVLLSLTRSHTHRAVTFGGGPQTLALALTRARAKLVVFGDPGTLFRRSQWEGPLDHLDEAAAARERELIAHLVRYLQGQGSQAQAFHVCAGSSS